MVCLHRLQDNCISLEKLMSGLLRWLICVLVACRRSELIRVRRLLARNLLVSVRYDVYIRVQM